MATYAIGDLQGCWRTLERLLRQLPLRAEDRLWLVGDLVNRGPLSLDCLRWARDQGPRLDCVLGNHDLKLLQVAAGVGKQKPGDTLDEILRAKDRDDLVTWLQSRPFLVRDGENVLVHAGLLPAWSVAQAESLAREAEAALRGTEATALLAGLRREVRAEWSESLTGLPRVATLAAVFTRLRTCTREGVWDDAFSGELADVPAGLMPWFRVPRRRSADHLVVFGHWSALGLLVEENLIALDTGCVWGRALTCVRLDDHAVFAEPAAENPRATR